jgi:hypothetical protein
MSPFNLKRSSGVEVIQSGSPESPSAGHLNPLFPLFSERLLAPDRPDLPQILKLLALESDEPLEFLARSGGRRHGDTIELMAEPQTSPDGAARCVFLVHGVRYVKDAGDLINALRTGDRLSLRPDPHNSVNPRALLVTTDGQPLGWVPDPILDFVHQMHAPSVTVIRANPPTFGHHLRPSPSATRGDRRTHRGLQRPTHRSQPSLPSVF